jgi:putative tryptophan/tyrosine transport system substrate-binding protein
MRWKLIALALIVLPAVTARSAPEGRVAVLLSAKVDEYEDALRGFKGTVPHRIVALYDMDADLDRGRKQLADIESKVKPDLIFAVGVWALQAVASRSSAVPVVYAMVLNPPSIIGTESRNITGASTNVPVEQTIGLLAQLQPQVKRVGVVFNRMKTGHLVTQAQGVARSEGLELVTREISSARDAAGALESFADGIDALWIVPDETVLSQNIVQQMLLFSYRRKIPVIGLSDRHAEMGALFALSYASSEDVGRQAGELAQAILGGRAAADVPRTSARKLYLTVNLRAAQKLGLEIPRGILARATNVIQ